MLGHVDGVLEHAEGQLRAQLDLSDLAAPYEPHLRRSGVHDLRRPGSQVEPQQQGRQVLGPPVLAVERLVGQVGLVGQGETCPPGVAEGVDREVGQQGRVDALAHSVGHGQGEVVGRRRPVEVVAVDRVGGFELCADVVLRAGARTSGKELPLHLGGEREAVGPSGLEVEVGVAFADDDLVSEHLDDLRQLLSGVGAFLPVGKAQAQDSDAVPPHAHRQVHGDRVVPVGALDLGRLPVEGPARGAAVDGDGFLRIGESRDRLQYGRRVVGHEQGDVRGTVLRDQFLLQGREEGVWRGGPQGALDRDESVHCPVTA